MVKKYSELNCVALVFNSPKSIQGSKKEGGSAFNLARMTLCTLLIQFIETKEAE